MRSRDYKDPQAVVYSKGEVLVVDQGAGKSGCNVTESISPTLACTHGGEPAVCLNSWDVQSKHIQPENGIAEALYSGECRGGGGESYVLNELENRAIVRRLTPLECERLQGFPDGWTDIGEWTDSKGKKHKDVDSPRYKALGNSIALPFWEWMAKRMVKQLEVENPTMGSLFDGIGGFPLVFSRVGCVPVWASEIEEFPIAVTKERFGNE